MKIYLSPIRSDLKLEVERNFDSLIINGDVLDFSPVPDGATIPSEAIDCEWIFGDVERIGGAIHLTILLPHGPDAPESIRFPEPIVDPDNGKVELPK